MAPRSLSPSRAGDFQQCPLLYRFRSVDRLPEAPTAAMVRGTLVHAVLERVFDLPAAGRTPEAASELVAPQWERIAAEDPSLPEVLFEGDAGGPAARRWLAEADRLVRRWFEVEDPSRLEPAERELHVRAEVSGLQLHGYVDRLDVAPDGRVRVVDYKTGRAPREAYAGRARMQLRFYGLVLWRSRGVLPARLQLVYLGDGQVLREDPDERALETTERSLLALWDAVEASARSGRWQPSPSRLCDWCAFRTLCPAFGGTPPPPPADALERVVGAVGAAGPG